MLASATRPPRRWIWPAAAGLLVFALLTAFALGVFMLRTASGTIVIDNLPENAVVEVDGERPTILPSGGEPLSIEKAAGKPLTKCETGEGMRSCELQIGEKRTLMLMAEDNPKATTTLVGCYYYYEK